jgi:hypothetical protein
MGSILRSIVEHRLCSVGEVHRLAIVPDMTHYEAFASTRVAEIVLHFLDGRSTGAASQVLTARSHFPYPAAAMLAWTASSVASDGWPEVMAPS